MYGQEVFKFVFLVIFKVAAYVFFAEFFHDYTKIGLSLKYSCMYFLHISHNFAVMLSVFFLF